jgi:hypothetical protein
MYRSRDRSISIAIMLWVSGPGFDSRQDQVILLFFTASRPTLGPTQPPIQWVEKVPFPDVKWPGREPDHSPPPSAEFENGRA